MIWTEMEQRSSAARHVASSSSTRGDDSGSSIFEIFPFFLLVGVGVGYFSHFFQYFSHHFSIFFDSVAKVPFLGLELVFLK